MSLYEALIGLLYISNNTASFLSVIEFYNVINSLSIAGSTTVHTVAQKALCFSL